MVVVVLLVVELVVLLVVELVVLLVVEVVGAVVVVVEVVVVVVWHGVSAISQSSFPLSAGPRQVQDAGHVLAN